jgi:uncharacterized membrane protein YsdA (DUF1294 family)/cold shock CspA family protein
MDEQGELVEWNDDRGFGLVQPSEGTQLFVHISAFERATRRPLAGDRLAFARGMGRDGRTVVVAAQIVGATAPPRPPRPQPGLSEDEKIGRAQFSRATRLALAAVMLAALVYVRPPALILVAYVVMGAVSFAVYWYDKRAARDGTWRVAEGSLHLIDLFGGILGGLLAQVALHHKTAKPSFALVTLAIVVAHVGLLGYLAFRTA